MMLDFPVSGLIKQIIPPFIRLTQEDEEFRKPWLIDLSGKANDPDDGLVKKTGKGTDDHKFYLHYRPHTALHLFKQKADTRRYEELLDGLSELYWLSAGAGHSVFKQLDIEFPGFNFLRRHEAIHQDLRCALRLLYYKPGEKILAKAHSDQSFLTLHIDESHPGLYLHGDTQCFEVQKDRALCFFGEKAEVVTGGKLPAMMHYAKATSEEWRWAIVCFIHIDAGVSDDVIRRRIARKKLSYVYPAD